MRGHEKIIASRLAGTTPKIVFLNDYPCKTDWFDNAGHATVCTAGDPLSSLDLRFLVGLKVSIGAESEARAKAIFAKAKAFGAKTVAACHIQPQTHAADQHGWCEIYHSKKFEHA